MTTKDEALRMALKKAFDLGKRYWSWADSEYSSHWKKADVAKEQFDQLIDDTIRKALAQPEQEPVATVVQFDGEKIIDASMEFFDKYPIGTELYTSPPHRKPLTYEEIEAIGRGISAGDYGIFAIARAIEAAHGIKE